MVEGVKRGIGQGMIEVGDKIGSYRIVRHIGQGGMGAVYAAFDENLQTQVALKFVAPDFKHEPDAAARFKAEAQMLAHMPKHPNIVMVHHYQNAGPGPAYLVMELLVGDTLATWIRKNRGTGDHTLSIFFACVIAEAMADVHEKNVIHRDLKPENIILVPDKRHPYGLRPTICDFGLAKKRISADDLHATLYSKTCGLLGTPVYSAPEQFGTEPSVGKPADVYALGLILYEMVTGKRLFQSDDTYAEIIARTTLKLPPLENVPPALAQLLTRMLATRSEERPPMEECGKALRSLSALSSNANVGVERVASSEASKATPNGRRAFLRTWVAPSLVMGLLALLLGRFAFARQTWRDEFESRAWDLRRAHPGNKELPDLLTTSLREVRQAEQVRPGERTQDLIAVLIELSEYERTHGRLELAQKYADECFERINEGLLHQPRNRGLRDDLAMVLSKRGKVWLARRKPDKAETDFQASINVFNQGDQILDGDEPMILATSRLELGQAELLQRKFAAAQSSFSMAAGGRDASKGDGYWRLMFAEASYFKAKSTSDEAQAIKDLNEAQATAQSGKQSWLRDALLARILCEYGWHHARKSEQKQAQTQFESARKLAKPLFDKAPTHKDNALILIEALRGLKEAGGAPEDDPCKIANQFLHDDPDDKRFHL